MRKVHKSLKEDLIAMENWEYLIHHIHVDEKTGKEIIHNCPLVDHLGNLYKIEHIKDDDGNIKHYVVGLIEDQKVYWNDEEVKEDGYTIPCANRQLES